jgi:hypothetical protein
MADNLIAIRDAMVNALAAEFTDWHVEGHGGRFTLDEVPLLLGRLPLMLVANIGVAEWTRSGKGEALATLNHAVYLLVADKSGTTRDEWALDAVEDLLWFLMLQTWSDRARSIPQLPMQAQNLYAKTVQNLRLAVWGIPFTQVFQIGR